MPGPLKRNSVIVSALAALFWWAFMFAKHDPALRDIIPFGDDPYDAVGSFGIISGVVIAVICLVRAFRPYRNPPSDAQRVYLIRSQAAIPLLVLITLGADGVAMVRHPAKWIDAPARNELLALLGGMALVSTAVLILVRAAHRTAAEPLPATVTPGAIAVSLALIVLAIYPEWLITGVATHLLTVVIGDVLLFAPMRLLLPAMVPYHQPETPTAAAPSRAGLRWGIVVGVAILIGAFAFVGEMSEGDGAMALRRMILVAAVFLGLAVAGLLVAYSFLGKPLGLTRS